VNNNDNHDYVICTRKVVSGEFIAEPGKTRYLRVPRNQLPNPVPDQELTPRQWMDDVQDRADGMADNVIDPAGDVVVFIHGYNNDLDIIMKRHRTLQAQLSEAGFKGLVISFDWPSADQTLNYYEDRDDASKTAIRLVSDTVMKLMARQKQGCQTNVHLLGHSTGAYVIREAFYQAQKLGALYHGDWKVSQIVLIGGDISSGSLAHSDTVSAPMFKRCLRLTNYSNRHDIVLKVSNAKRAFTRPRVGRVGIPDDANLKCVDVDCTAFFESIDPQNQTVYGTFCHSWHIGNPVFAQDLAMTLHGGIDRNAVPTRRRNAEGRLELRAADKPAHIADWLVDFDGRDRR